MWSPNSTSIPNLYFFSMFFPLAIYHAFFMVFFTIPHPFIKGEEFVGHFSEFFCFFTFLSNFNSDDIAWLSSPLSSFTQKDH